MDFLNFEEKRQEIENIILIEWKMFQAVNNIGGRASCQDDWETFHIMRYSHYSAWSGQMIISYKNDLETALKQGRNLIAEKYGYMMEDTAPEYYKKEIEPYLPVVDSESKSIIKEIVDYMINCEKEFAVKYAGLSKAGRPVELENEDFTSVRTYLTGEMKTYSKNTLEIFLQYIRQYKTAAVNIVSLIKDTMVKMYGYSSLEDAEQKMMM
jgi:hypothetical protein